MLKVEIKSDQTREFKSTLASFIYRALNDFGIRAEMTDHSHYHDNEQVLDALALFSDDSPIVIEEIPTTGHNKDGRESVAAGGRLTEEELHAIWDFATETPGGDVDPKWLISMVEEIRVWRNVGNALVGLVDTKDGNIDCSVSIL